ncbi:MAG: glycosyltransferase [Pseudomonadota bacterium]
MIRVAFGSVPKDGGTFTFYRNIRPHLLEWGVDLRCVSVGKDQAALTEQAFVDEGCVQLAASTTDLKQQAKAFADWCSASSIDIVIGINSPAILSAIIHLPEGIRAIARCANGFDEGYRLTLIGRERLQRIVALVPRLRDDLSAHYGVDPAAMVLIPNGAAPDRYENAAARQRGSDGAIQLGFLGRLEHGQKGVMHIPAILDGLDRRGVQYRLRIAGKGRHEYDLKEQLQGRMRDGRVTFEGVLTPDAIPPFLSQIDVFLFTSHFEGCPNALLEAMMAGTVPVSWRLAGITDFLLVDGITGWLSETGDTETFAEHVAVLAKDRAALAAMASKGAIAARSRFSIDACAKAYAALFRELMDEAPAAWTPKPWSAFNPDPMFRRHPLARFLPEQHRIKIRKLAGRIRAKKTVVPNLLPKQSRSEKAVEASGQVVHQIINSAALDRGGAERLVRHLHDNLPDKGIRSHLVALEETDLAGLENASTLGLSSPYDPRALSRLRTYCKRVKPKDVVHVHLFPASAHSALLAHLGAVKGQLIFTEHNTSNRRRRHMLGGLIDRRVYRAFDRIVAISEGVESELLAARPWLCGLTTVIPNGCEMRFDAVTQRPKRGTVGIISIGRLVEQKGFSKALDAVAEIQHHDFNYTILGDGPLRDSLVAKAASLGIADKVTFAGHCADVKPFLENADICLIPSLWEGFGLVAVEAMNASLPVVASNVPGLREVVGKDDKAAILVDPLDTTSISAALVSLLASSDLRTKLGSAGFIRAGEFGLDAFLNAHVALYENCHSEAADAV